MRKTREHRYRTQEKGGLMVDRHLIFELTPTMVASVRAAPKVTANKVNDLLL